MVVHPCGHKIASKSLLLEFGDLSPHAPDEWLTTFLADTADD